MMSAFGPKQTLAVALHESAFGGKADMTICGMSAFAVAFGGKADMAWPLAAHAQQTERVRRIGVLIPFTATDPEAKARNVVFEQSLQQLGWTVGRDLQIDY